MKKLLILYFSILLSLAAYSQEDTALIGRIFNFMNNNFRQNIADSMLRPLTRDKFPKDKFYRSYIKRKKVSDDMYLHAFYIPCNIYYIYDSLKTKSLDHKTNGHYPEYVFTAKEYSGRRYVFDGSKYEKRYYTFYFIDNRHFKVIKVTTGPENNDCIFYYNRIIFGTSEQFSFELNAYDEIELKSATMMIHN